MKSQKGITLISLVVYIVAMSIVVGIVATITSFFYSNTESISESATDLGEFNKFNLEMVREVKQAGNRISSIENEGTRITFTSGNIFTFQDGGIYKNKIKLCTGVINCQFRKSLQEEKEILTVLFETQNFARTIEYVMEDSGITNTNLEENYTQVSSKQYVQNGLQLHYDAINNTGDGHSSTTMTWRDLSKNHRDGILTDVTWEGYSAVFNGTSSWVNCGELNSDYQTLIITFSGTENEIMGNHQDGGAKIVLNNTTKKIEAAFYINDDFQLLTSETSVAEGKVYQVALAFDGITEKLYINGAEENSVTLNDASTITKTNRSTVMALGANSNGAIADNAFFAGNIYSAAIYDRALTAEEILQNYQIDKERYNIEK